MRLLYHGQGTYVPGRPIGPAEWTHHDLLVVTSGHIRLKIGEKEWELEEADGLIIPPRHPFEGESIATQSRLWVLHYAFEDRESGSRLFSSTSPRPLIKGFECRFILDLLKEFSENWTGLRGGHREPYPQLLIGTLFAKIKRNGERTAPPIPGRLQAALSQPAESVSEMAGNAGLRNSRFRHEFKKHLGISPSRFLRQSQMETARRLLAETSTPIKDISQQLGYSEPAAFHRAFVRESGLTPKTFRCRHSPAV